MLVSTKNKCEAGTKGMVCTKIHSLICGVTCESNVYVSCDKCDLGNSIPKKTTTLLKTLLNSNEVVGSS